MGKEFIFPDLGEGITEGELVRWLVKEGDTVKEDQDVAEIETDKALVNIPSPMAGVVEKLNYKEGDAVQVGSVLMTFMSTGETPATPSPKEDMSSVKSSVARSAEEEAQSAEEEAPPPPSPLLPPPNPVSPPWPAPIPEN